MAVRTIAASRHGGACPVRVDRDTVLIALTLSPLGFMGFVVYQWYSTGSFPLGLFTWAMPTVPLPAVPQVTYPPAVVSTWQSLTSNGMAIAASLAIGLLLGVVVVGTLSDSVRGLSRLMHRGDQAPVEEVETLELPETGPNETYFVG